MAAECQYPQDNRAIACGNIHASAECNSEVREVAADSSSLVESFPGRLGGPRILVAEGDMVMDIITDRLNPSPSRRRLTEKLPSRFGQPICFAISAAQQVDQSLFGQICYGVLLSRGNNDIRFARISYDRAAL